MAYAAEPNDSNGSFSRCFDADAEVVHALLDIVEQHTVHRILDAGAIQPNPSSPHRAWASSSVPKFGISSQRIGTVLRPRLTLERGKDCFLNTSASSLNDISNLQRSSTHRIRRRRPLTIDALVHVRGCTDNLSSTPPGRCCPKRLAVLVAQRLIRGETFAAWLATTRLPSLK